MDFVAQFARCHLLSREELVALRKLLPSVSLAEILSAASSSALCASIFFERTVSCSVDDEDQQIGLLLAFLAVGADRKCSSASALLVRHASGLPQLVLSLEEALPACTPESTSFIACCIDSAIELVIARSTEDELNSESLANLFRLLQRAARLSDAEAVAHSIAEIFNAGQVVDSLDGAPGSTLRTVQAHGLLVGRAVARDLGLATAARAAVVSSIASTARLPLCQYAAWMHKLVLPRVVDLTLHGLDTPSAVLSHLSSLLPRHPRAVDGAAELAGWEVLALATAATALRRSLLSSGELQAWTRAALRHLSNAAILLTLNVLLDSQLDGKDTVIFASIIGHARLRWVCLPDHPPARDAFSEGFTEELVSLVLESTRTELADGLEVFNSVGIARRILAGPATPAAVWATVHLVERSVACCWRIGKRLASARLTLMAEQRPLDLLEQDSVAVPQAKHWSLWWKGLGGLQEEFSAKAKTPALFSVLGAQALVQLAWERCLCLPWLRGASGPAMSDGDAYVEVARIVIQAAVVRWLVRAAGGCKAARSAGAALAHCRLLDQVGAMESARVAWATKLRAMRAVLMGGTEELLPELLRFSVPAAVAMDFVHSLLASAELGSGTTKDEEASFATFARQLAGAIPGEPPAPGERFDVRTAVLGLVRCVPRLLVLIEAMRIGQRAGGEGLGVQQEPLREMARRWEVDERDLLGPLLSRTAAKHLLAALLCLLRDLLHNPFVRASAGCTLPAIAEAMGAPGTEGKPREADAKALHTTALSWMRLTQDGGIALLLASLLRGPGDPTLHCRALMWHMNRTLWTESLDLRMLADASPDGAVGMHPLWRRVVAALAWPQPVAAEWTGRGTTTMLGSPSPWRSPSTPGQIPGLGCDEVCRRLWGSYLALETPRGRLCGCALFLKEMLRCFFSAGASADAATAADGAAPSPSLRTSGAVKTRTGAETRLTGAPCAFPYFDKGNVELFAELGLASLSWLLSQAPIGSAETSGLSAELEAGPYDLAVQSCLLVAWTLHQLAVGSVMNLICRAHGRLLLLVGRSLQALADALEAKTEAIVAWRNSTRDARGGLTPLGTWLHWAAVGGAAMERILASIAATAPSGLRAGSMTSWAEVERKLRPATQRVRACAKALERTAEAHALRVDEEEVEALYARHISPAAPSLMACVREYLASHRDLVG